MIFPIIVFILILSLLVFVHELGHFATARRFGVRSEEFGLGFPPRVFGWQKDKNGKLKFFWSHQAPLEEKIKDPETGKDIYINKGDTIYSFNLIPLGGFVKIKGEMGENLNDPDSFANKPASKRSLILLAGVSMNLLLSIVLLSIGLLIGLPQVLDDSLPASAMVREQKIQISFIKENSPAAKAELKKGDTILNIDGQSFTSIQKLQDYIDSRKGQEIELTINRLSLNTNLEEVNHGQKSSMLNKESGVLTKKVAVLGLNEIFSDSPSDSQRGAIGVGLVNTGIVSFPWYEAGWRGVVMTGGLLKDIFVAFYGIIKNLIIHQPVSVDVAGPVGIAVLTKEVTKLGFIYVLQFTALLSLNLAIINGLPIPALDGGRLLFILIEKIRRRPVDQQLEAKIHNVVFIILLLLIALVTYKDIMRFIIN